MAKQTEKVCCKPTQTQKIKTKGADIMYENIPEVMTLKECQQILKVGKNTMLELLHTRQIEGFKIGSRWKIPKESVVDFIRYR